MLWPFRKSPAWNEVNYWALDLETSGLEPSDQILSVGMVPIRSGVIEFGAHYYSLVRPARPETLSVEGIKAHHILPGELETAPPLAQVLDEVQQRIGRDVLVLHFSSIDLGFLGQSCKALGRPWTKPLVADTAVLLARLNERRRRLEPYSQPYPGALGAARAIFGLPGHLEHHALWDALATAELFLVLRNKLSARTLRQLV
ncbi:3'-5' exonuclease [Meiothermus sp.]|uniref:3'-5' exonuclease n=1 Tax=Meiothermus sp. TaxID=1955249 RepID=UPI00307DBB59